MTDEWCSDEVVRGKVSSVQGTYCITYSSAHCYFSTAFAFVVVNCFRLNLMFITKLVAATMNSMSIMHFIDTETSSYFMKFTRKKWIVKKRCGLSKRCDVGISGAVITQIFCRTGV